MSTNASVEEVMEFIASEFETGASVADKFVPLYDDYGEESFP